MKHYSTQEQVVSALRATKSKSKRFLLDTAANMIEAFSNEMFRLYQENLELKKKVSE
jgi:hypothetical protein